MERIYMAVDFETIDTHIWWSAAFLICKYPSGNIVEEHLFFTDRKNHLIQSAEIACFWDKNPYPFEHNQYFGNNRDPVIEEKKICTFIENLKKRMPYFFLVSDNPTFDIHILDDILTRNGYESLLFQRGRRQCFDNRWTAGHIV